MAEFLKIVFSLGILQALLILLMLLVYPKKPKAAPFVLASILLLSIYLMLSELLELFNIQFANLAFFNFSILVDFLFPPLILLFILYFLSLKNTFQLKDLGHASFFLIALVGFLFVSQNGLSMETIACFVIFKILVLLNYAPRIIKSIKQYQISSTSHEEKLKESFSLKMAWSYFIVVGLSYLSFWITYFNIHWILDSDMIGILSLTGFVYFLSFNIIRYPGLLLGFTLPYKNRKYYKSTISNSEKQEISERLISHLKSSKSYLNPGLSLNTLSSELGLSTNSLSQVINETMDSNFLDLINGYRLAEVKQKLIDPGEDHKTILALALESGFKSKATFNRIFKKQEHMTPLEFKRKNRS